MEAAITQFCDITNASARAAEHFLNRASGNVDEAVELFFAQPPAAPQGGAAPPAARKPRRTGSSAPGTIRSLGDLAGGDDSESEDDHNDYYVGGEKSGQVVRGAPPKGLDEVGGVFDAARRAGAQEGRPEDLPPSAAGGSGSGAFRAFSGGARTLAGGEPAAPEPAAPGAAAAAAGATPSGDRTVTIVFFRNGIFTVDDGEPRAVSDPANLPFMEAIMAGRCPPELDPGDPAATVHVNLLRRDEDWAEPARPRHRAFAGAGHRLGAATEAAPPPAAAPPLTGAPVCVGWEGADLALRTTTLQLRLADGTRQVAEFNLTHTVGDIRRFIRAAQPHGPSSYRLATAFPAATLDDDSTTIEAAGLASAVVIQKL